MDKKYFTTTPIYYVNDVPHIGHTYTTIAADVITRFYDQKNPKTSAALLTGTDEHGAKIEEAAKKHNLTPKEYADQISSEFKKAWESLDINFARFIRTTDEDHIKTAQQFLQQLFDADFIEHQPRLYTGLYCVGHEKFMSEDELVDGLCPDHKTKPIKHSEENYYFKLSKFQDQIIDLIESDQIKIRPLSRKNEVLGKLKLGLEDISISRANLKWGIPLPFDPSHTAYVWVEALINYYTFGKPNNLWPANLHLIGKDILWFHAIIWPAMLLAIKEDLPKEIFAHGFFTIGGEKMSKTIGNVISPQQLIEKYGVDGTRFVLLSSFAFGEDGDFSWELFNNLYNSQLANGLGNLTSRVAKLCEKINYQSPDIDQRFDPEVEKALSEFKFNEALNWIWSIIQTADRRINEEKPWEKSGDDLKEDLDELVRLIQKVAYNLKPFLPQTSAKILDQFSGEVKSSSPLFPRIN